MGKSLAELLISKLPKEKKAEEWDKEKIEDFTYRIGYNQVLKEVISILQGVRVSEGKIEKLMQEKYYPVDNDYIEWYAKAIKENMDKVIG